MHQPAARIIRAIAIGALLAAGVADATTEDSGGTSAEAIDVGSRPAMLVDGMDPGRLKDRLGKCKGGDFSRTDFSIGHRGAPLRYPEHTRESYEAAARQGAGIVECDVTFTSDRELVCRHSQCDLHSTTNILEIPELAAKCSLPFTPYDKTTGKPASARCCTSDITLAEFRMLQGKKDSFNPSAATVAEYVAGSAGRRADAQDLRGAVMTHAESIELFRQLGVKMAPELKSAQVEMPWQGSYTQHDYAQQMIDEYKRAGIEPSRVWVQSFNLWDIKYWIENEPRFSERAIYLDSRVYDNILFRPSRASFESLKRLGVNIIAPPIFALLSLDARGKLVPSDYARLARAAGLDLVTWTFERSDLRDGAVNDKGDTTFYYEGIGEAVAKDSDMYEVLDVLARDVGIKGIFSDWPATVTYYANCMGLQ